MMPNWTEQELQHRMGLQVRAQDADAVNGTGNAVGHRQQQEASPGDEHTGGDRSLQDLGRINTIHIPPFNDYISRNTPVLLLK